jgi:hypothetical protein
MNGKVLRVASLLCLTFVIAPIYAGAKVVVASLERTKPDVGVLFKATDHQVAVTVRDDRADKAFVGGAILGPKADADKGVYLGYATPKDAELASFLRTAAEDAVAVLGMKPGAGYSLEIVVKDLRVDMYRLSGFSPMNCIGYAALDTSLRAPDGTSLGTESLKLTYYETTVPKMSMKEVVTGAISRIFTHAAWQAASTALLKHLPLEPDMAQIGRVVEGLDRQEKEILARQAIFWLALAGQSGPPVKDKLLALVRTSEDQDVHQAAAEAIGMLGITEAKEDLAAILAGKKAGGWDNTDNEHVWYLLRALGLLGEADLRARIPKVKINMPSKLEDLVVFQETGAFPEVTQAEAEKQEKARQALDKKRPPG